MKINLSNFLSFGENTPIDIPEGITLVRGDNGVGKSGLLEGFTYAIWGKARGTSEFPGGDHLIRDNCSTMYACVQFTTPNQIHILRGRDNGSTKLDISICGANQQFNTLDAGEKIIDGLVNIEYDTFIKTAYFQQGKDKAFSELTSTESRKKVVEMLGLDRWKDKQHIVQTKLIAIDKQCIRIKSILDSMNQPGLVAAIKNAEINVQKAKVLLSSIESEISSEKVMLLTARANANILQSKLSTIDAQIALQEEKQKTLTQVKSEIEIYSQKLWNFRKQLKGYTDRVDDIDKEISRLDAAVDKVDVSIIGTLKERDQVALKSYYKVVSEQKTALTTLEANLLSLEHQKTKIVNCGPSCPILGHKCDLISEENMYKNINCINDDINTVSTQIMHITNEIKQMQSDVDIYENNIKKFDDITEKHSQAVSRRNALQLEKKNINELVAATKDNVNNMNTLMQNANSKHLAISVELEYIHSNMKTVSALRQQVVDANNIVATIEENIKAKERQKIEHNNQVVSSQTIIDMSAGKLLEFDKHNIEYETLIADQRMYELLYTAFGPNGVPAMQIEAMKNQIEVLANNILQYGGQHITLSIVLKEPKKSGDGVKDVFKILVKSKDRVIPLFRLSGGEAYWVDLSIRAALFLVWRSRNPDNILDLLMIDEGIGKIDDNKRRILIDVLKYLSTKVKRIILITHTDLKNLIDEFDGVITISKQGDISHVT